jgi:glycine hydroxymethyltransferase
MNIFNLIEKEQKRQAEGINLIASENYAHPEVLKALGSVLTNKYAEGYPGRRYYSGTKYVDDIESEAIRLAQDVFGAEYANVQPYSGTPANLEVYFALLKPGDRILSMSLDSGGHLSHGHKVTASGKLFEIINYNVDQKTGLIDMDEVSAIARKVQPKLIVAGFSAYPRNIDWKTFGQIAHDVEAYSMADISHISGLVAGGVLDNPMPYFDVVTTTTHKSLRGPRGAIILAKEKYSKQIAKSVFPGMQGGPHLNVIAGIAIALEKSQTEEFRTYAKQILKNAQVLAGEFTRHGFRLVSGGTDNHLMLIDLSDQGLAGVEAEAKLEAVGIYVNKNMIPYDTRKPNDPSGIRIGTPAVSARGMKESEMKQIGGLIADTLKNTKPTQELKSAVSKLTADFPV